MNDWPDAYGRILLDEVSSTLDAANTLLSDHPAPFWVLAHRQTAARGRRGRAWSMPEGNFAVTLMLQPRGTPSEAALRSFVMSLALYHAFVEVTGRAQAFGLKWPNDVLLNGGKVAGILLESAGQSGRVENLAIGVGINLIAAPAPEEVEAGAVRPVSLKSETGTLLSAEAFLQVLAGHYAQLEMQFQEFGFGPIRKEWMAHAAKRGEVITARTSRSEITGTFEDVDAEGHLVLRGSNGVTRIAAADIYF